MPSGPKTGKAAFGSAPSEDDEEDEDVGCSSTAVDTMARVVRVRVGAVVGNTDDVVKVVVGRKVGRCLVETGQDE